jgi:hypothetical protein
MSSYHFSGQLAKTLTACMSKKTRYDFIETTTKQFAINKNGIAFSYFLLPAEICKWQFTYKVINKVSKEIA